MSATRETLLNELIAGGVVAVIRAPSKDVLEEIAAALLAGGVRAIEVTMTTPGAIDGIEALNRALGDRAIIGVGTVIDTETCRHAIAAGAQFIVSPVFDPGIMAAIRQADRIAIPGAFTPTEILRARTAGADIVKVFPSTTLGPGYFKDLLAPLPQLKLMPTGGVTLQNAPQWIKAGAVSVGAGSSLVPKEAVANRDWGRITGIARAFTDAVRAARAGSL